MRMSLKLKAIAVILLFTVSLSVSIVFISYNTYTDSFRRHYSSLALSISKSTASVVDAEKVKAVLTKVAADDPLVLDDPAPVVRLLSHGDSALVYTLYVWCDRSNYWTVYYNMQEQVKAAFDAAGISIPYPQMDIHIDK